MLTNIPDAVVTTEFVMVNTSLAAEAVVNPVNVALPSRLLVTAVAVGEACVSVAGAIETAPAADNAKPPVPARIVVDAAPVTEPIVTTCAAVPVAILAAPAWESAPDKTFHVCVPAVATPVKIFTVELAAEAPEAKDTVWAPL